MRRSGSGFTLIELLTVIAIIAILAAILFPVLKMVGDSARNTTCMSNMKALWQALRLYKDDEQRVPSALYGYAENPDGSINTTGTGFVNADRIIHGFLYTRARVNDKEKHRCPFNAPPRPDVVTVAHFPPRPPSWPNRSNGTPHSYVTDPGTPVASNCPSDAAGYIDCWRPPEPLPAGVTYGQPKVFYIWDSYDISPRVDAGGNVVRQGGQIVYDRRYLPDWTGVTGTNDLTSQLKYPNPPDDKTIVTYCSWHAALAKKDKCPTINMAGKASMAPVGDLFTHGANYFNR